MPQVTCRSHTQHQQHQLSWAFFLSHFHHSIYNKMHSCPLRSPSNQYSISHPVRTLNLLNPTPRPFDVASLSASAPCGHAPRPIFDLLLRYAVSEDGALHAEKYYRTVTEEFSATRPAFRWRQLVALARVTASEYGRPAGGLAEAREVLNVKG